jgi:hypothetical protein
MAEKSFLELATLSQAGRGAPAEEGRGTAQAPVGVSLPGWTQ